MGEVQPTDAGCFEVTIHSALRERFNEWLRANDQEVSYFGANDAGVPVYVAIIRRGSATERRFLDG